MEAAREFGGFAGLWRTFRIFGGMGVLVGVVAAALVAGAEAGLSASGGNCADSDAGLCRVPEIAAKVEAEASAAGGNCTTAAAGACPCWELDAYSTDAAAFEDLKSYSGGCATDEVYPSANCAEVTEGTDPTEGDEDQHGRIRDPAERLMKPTVAAAALDAGCITSGGPVLVAPSTTGTELADFPLTDTGQNWCGPWLARTDDNKTCTKSIFDANGALFLIITGEPAPFLSCWRSSLDADPQRARVAGGALIVIFFQCSLVGAYELLCGSKGDDFDEDAEP